MKKVLRSVLALVTLLGLLPGYISAQTTALSLGTNTTQWTCRLQNGVNTNPLTFAQANSGTWGAPVDFTASNCQPTGTLPGTPITHSTSNFCSASENTTRFFRTSFNLNISQGMCVSNLLVRADNGFRVYIDGNVVPGTNTLGDAGEPECSLINNVIGDQHTVLYTINIASFLNTTSLNHTIIIEVVNCNYPTWLSARIDISPNLNLDPAFTWTLTGASTGGSLSLSLTPQNGNFTTHHWLVEVSSSPNGPFTVVYNSQTDIKFRPSVVGPKTITGIPRSSYIRITHTVFSACGSASTTIIILTPAFQGGNETYLSAVSNGVINYIDQASSEFAFSEVIVTEERVAFYEGEYYQNVETSIFPNPFNNQFRIYTKGLGQYDIIIYNSMGRMIMEKNSDESNTQELDVDMSGFATGIYRVSILDKSGNLIESKNVLKSN